MAVVLEASQCVRAPTPTGTKGNRSTGRTSMLQPGGGGHLAKEPLQAEHRRQLGTEDREHHGPPQAGVPREKDPGHTPAGQLTLQRVAP